MAKGSAMGLWRGKKGSSVFYRVANSKNAQKQGIRERVYEIRNPRTSGMAGQRMKLLPAIRIYGQLKEIIDRGFETSRYGVPSFRKFMSKALRMKSGFPAVPSGDTRAIPGRYIISSGSLREPDSGFEDNDALTTGLKLNTQTEPTTMGELWTQLIAGSQGIIQNGDQLTFCLCDISENHFPVGDWPWDGLNFSWSYQSFIVDIDSEEPSGVIPNSQDFELIKGNILLNARVGDGAIENLFLSCANNHLIAAYAIIISRQGRNGKPLRSTSEIHVFPTVANVFIDNGTSVSRARRTYQNQSALSSDWPVQAEGVETSESAGDGEGGGDIAPEDRP